VANRALQPTSGAGVLAENMVISIEPGVYLHGVGGLRHSDTVLVTEDGYEPLTRCPTDIDSLTIKGWKPVPRLKGWWVRRALRLTPMAKPWPLRRGTAI